MEHSLGMKDGAPIIGSTWLLDNSGDPFIVTGKPDKWGTVPMTQKGKAGHTGLLSNFQQGRRWSLVSIPGVPEVPSDGEITWSPHSRPMLEWEGRARAAELDGYFADAKEYTKRAALEARGDVIIAAEESALTTHRYVSKAHLKSLSPGDRLCYEIKNLKEFQAHQEAFNFLYWNE